MKERREGEEGGEVCRGEEKRVERRGGEERGVEGRGGSDKRKLLRFCLSSDHSRILAH